MSTNRPSQTEIIFSQGKQVDEVGSVRALFADFNGDFDSNISRGPRRGDTEHLANLIEQWVVMPKYNMTARMQNAARSEEGMLQSVTKKFGNGQNSMTMYPARLADPKNGVEKDYFPTPTDEVIEFVLLHLMADPSMGCFAVTDKNTRSGLVRFRLADIIKTLEAHGIKKNRTDIKHSLAVMARTHYEFKFGSGKTVQDSIISSMIEGGEDQYWTVRFSLIVSGAMEALTYRQFPFSTYLSLKSAVDRWILTRMSLQTNLGSGYPHVIMLSEAEEAGVVNCKNRRDNLRQLKDGIQSLCDRGVIDQKDVDEYPITRVKEAGKTIDIRISIPGNKWLIGHSMKANTRAKNNRVLAHTNKALPAYS